jgi:hypothetical protein
MAKGNLQSLREKMMLERDARIEDLTRRLERLERWRGSEATLPYGRGSDGLINSTRLRYRSRDR